MNQDMIKYFTGFEFLKDILLIIIGAAITWAYEFVKKHRGIMAGKKQINKIINAFTKEGIVSLANAYPYYEPRNILINDSKEEFFLTFPGEYENTFNCREQDIIFNGRDITELGNKMGIMDFPQLIEKHRIIVANDFIQSQKTGRKVFNNTKFGVRNITVTKTDNKDENDVVSMRLYLTDYFTHKVMRSIYHELQEKGAEISSGNRIEDIIKYYPFLTSFGIDSLLALSPQTGMESLVVVKRSKHMANMDKDRWHVSMNEGLSTTDLDPVSDKVSLYESVRRGYLEELGISYNNHMIDNEFRDIFMVKDNFEIGITTIAKVNLSIEDFKICFNGAEDSSMETTGSFFVIPNTPGEIKRFIKKNEDEMTGVLRYCLEMCISRMI